MTQPLRLATKNFVTLSAGDGVARLITVISTIYIARVLGAESYGLVGFVAAIIVYFATFVDFGIESLGPREIASDRLKREILIPSVIALRLVLFATAAILIVLVAWLFFHEDEARLLSIYALTLLPVALQTRWVHVGFQKTFILLFTQILSESAKLVLLFLLIRGPLDVFRVPFAQFTGEILAALLLLFWTWKQFTEQIQINLKAVFPVFRRSKHLLFTALLGLLIYNSDVLYLRFFRQSKEVGLYLASFALINFLGQLGNTIRLSLLPALSRLQGADRKMLHHRAAVRVIALAVAIAGIAFLFAQPLVQFIFGQGYQESVLYFQILIWSIPLLFYRSVLQAVLLANRHEHLVFRMTALTAALTLLVNLWMIPRYGAVGASITTVSAEGLRMTLAAIYARRP